jgi:glycosyltransferase involved in cell wall biosynthesis
MDLSPLVSVIVIFFNAEPFLDEAIHSVLEQDYPNWELLLVDDGSSDGSTRIALNLVHHTPQQVRYFEHSAHANRGMSASRNLGIQHARGEYIAFLDADDVWLPNKLSEQTALLEAHPDVGMTYGHALIWSSWTGRPGDTDYRINLGVPANTLVSPPNLLPQLLRNKAQTPMTSNAMLRRSMIESVGGFEEEFPAIYEDQVFFSKVEMHTAVYVSALCWVKYRQHPLSCTAVSARTNTYLSQRRPFLEWLAEYMDRLEVAPDSPARRALQRELWPYHHPRLHALLEPFIAFSEKMMAFWALRSGR